MMQERPGLEEAALKRTLTRKVPQARRGRRGRNGAARWGLCALENTGPALRRHHRGGTRYLFWLLSRRRVRRPSCRPAGNFRVSSTSLIASGRTGCSGAAFPERVLSPPPRAGRPFGRRGRTSPWKTRNLQSTSRPDHRPGRERDEMLLISGRLIGTDDPEGSTIRSPSRPLTTGGSLRNRGRGALRPDLPYLRFFSGGALLRLRDPVHVLRYEGRIVPILIREQGIGRGEQPVTWAADRRPAPAATLYQLRQRAALHYERGAVPVPGELRVLDLRPQGEG